jgi:hypothetical protein
LKNALFRRTAACALIAASLFVLPRRALACTCNYYGTAQEAIEQSSMIFSGRVIALGEYSVYGAPSSATFQVVEVWKGPVEETIHVVPEGDCAYYFEVGQQYLVYANEDQTGYTVSSCSRTNILQYVVEDLQALGAGTIPDAAPSNLRPAIISFCVVGFVLWLAIFAWATSRDFIKRRSQRSTQ